ncbi:chemotaxis protein CheA [Motiliproteus sediminis]|uniref:chemotaxis protein CheA n=1 Tax=Motiliproteus sediminis TaxID=1468178 RepID=UPI001AEF5104|nr:chemotaxis protein CheA [Motiliproteus sediminis]
MSDILDQAHDTFISECFDLLAEMETNLQQLQVEPENPELVHAVFRVAHTIKGSAGLFGQDEIVSFTHGVENALDRVRDGLLTINGRMIDLLLECRDHLERLIEGINQPPDRALVDDSRRLLDQLKQLCSNVDKAQQSPADDPTAAISAKPPAEYTADVDREQDLRVSNCNWHISLHFGVDVFRNGMEPLSFIRYLGQLGRITSIQPVVDRIPCLEQLDPESCFIGFEIDFDSDTDKQTIMDVFEFVADDSRISILPPHSKLADYAELITQLKLENANYRIGELLTKSGALTERELNQALAQQQSKVASEAHLPLGQILVEQGSIDRSTLGVALAKQKREKERHHHESKSIRVDAERLDQLINLVGELVIAGAGTQLKAEQLGDEGLQESVSVVSRLVEEIRDRSLRLRMVHIGETFNRFNRVVRDVSRELGKTIRLEIQGGDTELDKSVVEKIGDPLTHLVRNAIDHGIESSEERTRAGKPAQGTVTLKSYHDSGNIVIEVADDGGGIDADKVYRKAVERGLVSEAQPLSEAEKLRLILEAGLSTKDAVSDLSGRGVGMDVVKKNVEALRGTIEVESQLGQGSTLRIRLPLTLSIIDGFLVGVGDSSYVIQLDSVVECIEFAKLETVRQHGGHYINLRGEVLPYLNLRALFGDQDGHAERENIVVVRSGGQKAGLIVDQLLGEYQTVIKPLSQIFARLSGISGSTILGSGDVAMILDIEALVKEAERGGHASA